MTIAPFLLPSLSPSLSGQPLPPPWGAARALLLASMLCVLTACATATAPVAAAPSPPDSPTAVDSDPLEPVNRRLLQAHLVLDRFVLVPAATGYRWLAPRPFRIVLRNVMTNLQQPIILVNVTLQGDEQAISDVAGRFMVNSFLGLGGILDVASSAGVPSHRADFGQTLGLWGVGPGPYLFLPVFGPSTVRDGFGTIVDTMANPVRLAMPPIDDVKTAYLAGTVASAVDFRARTLDEFRLLQDNALDLYVTLRSMYRQKREAMIQGGAAVSGRGGTAATVEADPYFDPAAFDPGADNHVGDALSHP